MKTTLLIILALIAAYLLSPPYVFWFLDNCWPMGVTPPSLETLRRIYVPASLLADAFPPYKALLNLQFHALGVHP